jgi:hypothetical protein
MPPASVSWEIGGSPDTPDAGDRDTTTDERARSTTGTKASIDADAA